MASNIAGLHVFVVMPFGKKKDLDGNEIDFDAVYADLIRPPLSEARADVVRADVEQRAGSILADMFQELLLADLVIADVTVDNPNAWYELGVRHALRPRGTVILNGGRARIPFDVGPERIFRYSLKDGRPDPGTLEQDRGRIRAVTEATWGSWQGRKDSPVYEYVPSLTAPDWRTLRVGDVNEYWDKLEAWQARVDAAIQRGQPGDVLLLAEEPPAWPLRLEALQKATKALVRLNRLKLALKTADKALELAPKDVLVRQQKALAYERLGQYIEARQLLEQIDREDSPEARAACGETRGLLGRVAKSEWRARACSNGTWRNDALTQNLLGRSAMAYAAAFRTAPADFFPGINAVTLSQLYHHLTGGPPHGLDIRPLMHGVDWAISCSIEKAAADPDQEYWLRASEAELQVLRGDVDRTRTAFAAAAAVARAWFQLDSSRQQLLLLQQLGFQPEAVAAGLQILESELQRFEQPQGGGGKQESDRVVLFAGQRADDPTAKADAALAAIKAKLDGIGAQAGDVGLCSGTCADILFAEACLARDMKLHLFIPEDEPGFLDRAVSYAGDGWRCRFYALLARPAGQVEYRIQPDALGPAPKNDDPDVRNERWLAYTAMAYGLDRLRLLCLWDNQPGSGPARLVEFVRREAGAAPTRIDPSSL